MRVYSPQERPFTEIRNAAVAIALIGTGQQHLGILFKTDLEGEVKLGDLAWHNDLRERNPKPHYLWIDPPISAIRALQVAVRCRQILKANQTGIPYGFSPPNDCFDQETARFLLGTTGVGLTCATFVLAVFKSAGVKLAILNTWPEKRAGDDEWVDSICESLLKDGAPAEHVEALRKNPGTRYRPEDVAGCGAADKVPSAFEVANTLGLQVIQKLLALDKPLESS